MWKLMTHHVTLYNSLFSALCEQADTERRAHIMMALLKKVVLFYFTPKYFLSRTKKLNCL